jgi:uncharacterized membrane protein
LIYIKSGARAARKPIESADGDEKQKRLEGAGCRPHIGHMTLIRKNTTLAKTVTFALVHFTVAFALGYLLTGSVAIASALAFIEPLANTLAYYGHERLWQRLAGAQQPAPLRGMGTYPINGK